jgi:sugar lactone lactonase YvrE
MFWESIFGGRVHRWPPSYETASLSFFHFPSRLSF